MQSLPVEEAVRKPGRLTSCPRCDGVGRQGRGLKRRPCAYCGGAGRVLSSVAVEEDMWSLDVFAVLVCTRR